MHPAVPWSSWFLSFLHPIMLNFGDIVSLKRMFKRQNVQCLVFLGVLLLCSNPYFLAAHCGCHLHQGLHRMYFEPYPQPGYEDNLAWACCDSLLIWALNKGHEGTALWAAFHLDHKPSQWPLPLPPWRLLCCQPQGQPTHCLCINALLWSRLPPRFPPPHHNISANCLPTLIPQWEHFTTFVLHWNLIAHSTENNLQVSHYWSNSWKRERASGFFLLYYDSSCHFCCQQWHALCWQTIVNVMNAQSIHEQNKCVMAFMNAPWQKKTESMLEISRNWWWQLYFCMNMRHAWTAENFWAITAHMYTDCMLGAKKCYIPSEMHLWSDDTMDLSPLFYS